MNNCWGYIFSKLDYCDICILRILPKFRDILNNGNVIRILGYYRYGIKGVSKFKDIVDVETIIKSPKFIYDKYIKDNYKDIDIDIFSEQRYQLIKKFTIIDEFDIKTMECYDDEFFNYFYGECPTDLLFWNSIYDMHIYDRWPILFNHILNIEQNLEELAHLLKIDFLVDLLLNNNNCKVSSFINIIGTNEKQLSRYINNVNNDTILFEIIEVINLDILEKVWKLFFNKPKHIEKIIEKLIRYNVKINKKSFISTFLYELSINQKYYKISLYCLMNNLNKIHSIHKWFDFILYNCPSLYENLQLINKLKNHTKTYKYIIDILKFDGFNILNN